MGLFDEDKLDDLIDAALRDEAMHDVPLDFRRGLEARLHMARLFDAEQRRFRRSVTLAATVCVGVLLLGIGGLLYADVVASLLRSVPGALGRVDYVAYLWGRWWQEVAITSATASIVMVATLYLAESRSAPGALQAP